jgi:putative ABC transport system permease protein
MKKFLNLFSILLAAIALVSLTVGGMGITNMMLVSVSERLKEIGIRKSVGATHSSIRYQFLFESIFLCSVAGLVGIFLGIATYQGAIFAASQLMKKKLAYEWVFDSSAIGLSVISIIAVGVLSGLAPAVKAERLQVIEALRSE